MKYVSLVGTQVMAVLSPLLSLVSENKKPEKVGFFHTFRTKDHAKTIKRYLIDEKHFKEEEIIIEEVSVKLDADKNGNLSPQKAIANFSAYEDCYFNLAGGLNYQIAACASEMDRLCHLLYPESAGIHYFKCNERNVVEHELYALPSPIDVLKLQGFGISHGDKTWSEPELLKRFKSECNLMLPNTLKENVVIRGVHFDYIFNIDNELKFLKFMGKMKDVNENLQLLRGIIALANERESFGELYHRDIIVVADDVSTAERLRSEGGGKISIVRVNDKYNKNFRKACIDLNKHLYPQSSVQNFPKPNFPKPRTISTGNKVEGNKKMHVVLGKDILPTLISVWTHRPQELVVFYTPGDKEIESYRLAILQNSSLLPVSKVSLLPMSITGKEILECTQTGAPGEVNISPGTKAQAAFLTMWAKKSRSSIYSLLNPQKKAIEIGGKSSKEMLSPDPLTLLKLSGVTIKSCGQNQKNLTPNTNNDIINSIRRISIETNRPLKHIPFDKYVPESMLLTENGKWFEELIGYCLRKCGADDVQVRIRTEWSEDRQKHLEQLHGDDEIFMTDIDVAARFISTYYVIECKARDVQKDEEKVIQKAQADASLFGRYAVPLVAYLQYDGEPYKKNNVYVFGYKTFTNPEALKCLIEEAVRVRIKTLPEE